MSKPASPKWYYFGCVGQPGHHLFEEGLHSAAYGHPLARFDGSLCIPHDSRLYLAALTRLGGLGYTALAFFDQTVDSRPGSNSIFFAPSLAIHPEPMLEMAKLRFPKIFARLPEIDLSRAVEQHEAIVVPYVSSALKRLQMKVAEKSAAESPPTPES